MAKKQTLTIDEASSLYNRAGAYFVYIGKSERFNYVSIGDTALRGEIQAIVNAKTDRAPKVIVDWGCWDGDSYTADEYCAKVREIWEKRDE